MSGSRETAVSVPRPSSSVGEPGLAPRAAGLFRDCRGASTISHLALCGGLCTLTAVVVAAVDPSAQEAARHLGDHLVGVMGDQTTSSSEAVRDDRASLPDSPNRADVNHAATDLPSLDGRYGRFLAELGTKPGGFNQESFKLADGTVPEEVHVAGLRSQPPVAGREADIAMSGETRALAQLSSDEPGSDHPGSESLGIEDRSAIHWLKRMRATERLEVLNANAEKLLGLDMDFVALAKLFPDGLESRFLFDFEQIFSKEDNVDSLHDTYREIRTLIMAESAADMRAVEDRRRALLHEAEERFEEVFFLTPSEWVGTLLPARRRIIEDTVRGLHELSRHKVNSMLGSLRTHRDQTLEEVEWAFNERVRELGDPSLPSSSAESDDLTIRPYDPLSGRQTDAPGTSVVAWLNGARFDPDQSPGGRPARLSSDEFLFNPEEFTAFAEEMFPPDLVSRYDFDFEIELARVADADLAEKSQELRSQIADEHIANVEIVQASLRALRGAVPRRYAEYEESVSPIFDPFDYWLWLHRPAGQAEMITNPQQLIEALDRAEAASIESLERRKSEMLRSLENAERARRDASSSQ